jgi:hypothetical protein
MWQKVKIFKKRRFLRYIMSFLWIDFSAQFFGKTALKKSQDGFRYKISLQKSIERKILLQKSLFSLFFSARISQFSKFTICEKDNIFKILSKIEVFILETYVQRKSCYKLHKESPKKNWLESENPWFRPLAGWQILTQ